MIMPPQSKKIKTTNISDKRFIERNETNNLHPIKTVFTKNMSQ